MVYGLAAFYRNKIKLFWLLLGVSICLGFLPAKLANATTIRVYLDTNTQPQLKIVQGSYELTGGLTNSVLAGVTPGDTLTFSKQGSMLDVSLNGSFLQQVSSNLALVAVEQDQLNLIDYKNCTYRGSFAIFTNGYIVNALDMEHYLCAVVGKEIGYNAPSAATQAQAVASRSYAYTNLGGSFYDVKSDIYSQVYGGYTAEIASNNQNVANAVQETAGMVLYYENQLVNAVFHSHSGGHTEDNENVWGNVAVPSLRGVDSHWDTLGSANYDNWQVTYSAQQLEDLAEKQMKRNGQAGSFGQFQELRLYATNTSGSGNTVSGRVTKAELVGTGVTVSAKTDSIRTMLGLKSTLFTASGQVSTAEDGTGYFVINGAGNKAKRPLAEMFALGKNGVKQGLKELLYPAVITKNGVIKLDSSDAGNRNTVAAGAVVISGKGYGHGVGMSQFGAMGMAKSGYDYQSILKHYYGGHDPSKLEFRQK